MVRYYRHGGKWQPIRTGKTTATDISRSTAFTPKGTMRSIHVDKRDIVAAAKAATDKIDMELDKDLAYEQGFGPYTAELFGSEGAQLNNMMKELGPAGEKAITPEGLMGTPGPSSAWPRMAKSVYSVTRDMTTTYTGQAEAVFDFLFVKQYFQQLAWEWSYLYGPYVGKRPSIKPLDKRWEDKFTESVLGFAVEVSRLYEKMFYESGYEPKWEQLCRVTISLRQKMPIHTTKTGTKGGWTSMGLSKVLVHTGSMAGFNMKGGNSGSNRIQQMGTGLNYMVILAQGGDAIKFRVHEYGMDIAITKRMRGFLNSQGWHIKADKKFIHIPKRPMLKPLINKLKEKAKDIILNIGKKNKDDVKYSLDQKVRWRMTEYADFKLQSKQWSMQEYNMYSRLPGEERYQKLYGQPWPYNFKPFRGFAGVSAEGTEGGFSPSLKSLPAFNVDWSNPSSF